MFVNGFHDYYECWSAGVQCEDLLVVAAPVIKGAKWVVTQWMRRRALL